MPVNTEDEQINFDLFPLEASPPEAEYLGIRIRHVFKDKCVQN